MLFVMMVSSLVTTVAGFIDVSFQSRRRAFFGTVDDDESFLPRSARQPRRLRKTKKQIFVYHYDQLRNYFSKCSMFSLSRNYISVRIGEQIDLKRSQ